MDNRPLDGLVVELGPVEPLQVLEHHHRHVVDVAHQQRRFEIEQRHPLGLGFAGAREELGDKVGHLALAGGDVLDRGLGRGHQLGDFVE